MSRFFDFDGCAASLCGMVDRHSEWISDSEWLKFVSQINMFMDECFEIPHGEVMAYAHSLKRILADTDINAPDDEKWKEIADATRSLMAELDANGILDDGVVDEWGYVFEGF